MIRVVREAAAIPGYDEPAPVPPGQRGVDGKHNGSATRGGLAGQILAAHERAEPATPPIEWSQPSPSPEPIPEPGPESPRDPGEEIGERLRQRLAALTATEATAPEPSTYRTKPTAMSAPEQLEQAAEDGWDPLQVRPDQHGRRSQSGLTEDTSSCENM